MRSLSFRPLSVSPSRVSTPPAVHCPAAARGDDQFALPHQLQPRHAKSFFAPRGLHAAAGDWFPGTFRRVLERVVIRLPDAAPERLATVVPRWPLPAHQRPRASRCSDVNLWARCVRGMKNTRFPVDGRCRFAVRSACLDSAQRIIMRLAFKAPNHEGIGQAARTGRCS